MLRPWTESWCEAIVELLRSGKLDGSVGGSFWMLRPRAESYCGAIVKRKARRLCGWRLWMLRPQTESWCEAIVELL